MLEQYTTEDLLTFLQEPGTLAKMQVLLHRCPKAVDAYDVDGLMDTLAQVAAGDLVLHSAGDEIPLGLDEDMATMAFYGRICWQWQHARPLICAIVGSPHESTPHRLEQQGLIERLYQTGGVVAWKPVARHEQPGLVTS